MASVKIFQRQKANTVTLKQVTNTQFTKGELMAETELEAYSTSVNKHVRKLSELLSANDVEAADTYFDGLDSSLLTAVLSRLPAEQRQLLITQTDKAHGAHYLHELPDVQTASTVEKLPPQVAASLLKELPKSEQADIVGDLTPEKQELILSEMPPENAEVVRDLVKYADDEAGGLMIVRYVAVNENETVNQIIGKLQANAEKYSDFAVQYIYVVDSDGRLQGVLPLRSLVLASPESKASQLMIADTLTVNAHAKLLELHEFFDEHRFVGIPVVDDDRRLLGVLRRGDLEEAISNKYAQDYLKTQGIVNEELRTMPLAVRSRRRLAWLSINIFLNLIAASVVAAYQETLAQVIALAVFLPIISDMSGCSGNQAVAVSMRELSLGLVGPKEVFRVWMKEVSVGLINGFCLGIFVALLATVWQGNAWLGLVVGIAMMVNTVIAVSIGGTLPLVMKRFNLDPALASGPILTTVTDMCGFFIVLGSATLILDRLI